MQDFWSGTAPFCNGSKYDCEKVPGYIAGEEDKCGDGNCCMTGHKVKCVFDPKRWKESIMYNNLQFESKDKNVKNYKPEFNWFGTAPFCNYDECDVINEGFLPMKKDNYGNGAKCVSGQKILGLKPVLPEHKQLLEKRKLECNKK